MLFSEYFSYDYKSGKFIWLKNSCVVDRVGTEAGSLDKYGYRILRLKMKRYKAHRVAWYLYYGVWPIKFIDHINGDVSDNRIGNLREVSNRENQQNQVKHRAGKLPGVSFHKKQQKWVAQISANNKHFWLGTFNSKLEALNAYSKANELIKEMSDDLAN